ncbi:MAG: cation diffusion facilitator family transporter [Cyclobacteriaceae bacterium]
MSNQFWITVSFIVAVVLSIVKFFAFGVTSSNAILTDALESLINIAASAFAWYSLRLSSQPRDINHPYGHGKIEFFSAGFEGALIMLAGVFITVASVQRIFNPVPLTDLLTGILLVAITMLVNGLIGYKLIYLGKKRNSIVLEADGRHLVTDAWSSLALILGVGIIYFTDAVWVDSLIGIAFAIIILYNGYRLLRKSIAGLMDETDPDLLKNVQEVLINNRRRNWIDVHNLRIQRYGIDRHIDCHLTLPFYYSLDTVHKEVDKLEEVLDGHLSGGIEVFVHTDPCIPGPCCHYCRIEDCHERKADYDTEIPWTIENLIKNQKHYLDNLDYTEK